MIVPRSSCMLTVLLLTISSGLSADPIIPPAIDFDTQIIPLLTRHGCNAGSCHGAAIGRGGFKLSLLGSDAASDHDAITRELEGRRINLSDPDLSLLLRKPSEQTGHEGGEVLSQDSQAYARVRTWIDEGAMRLNRRSLVALAITPQQARLASVGQTTTLSAIATFDDGHQEDVTDATVFTANDRDAVEVDPASRTLTVRRRGVHIVIARYLDRVMPIRLIVPLHEQMPDSVAGPSSVNNPIDDYINTQLDQLHLPASPRCDDHAFLRRLMLDMTGRLPTPSQLQQFTQDQSTDKRSQWIQRLLATESFAEYWSLKWANVLGIDSKELQPEGAEAFQRWIAQRLSSDAPMNETAAIMITAVGDSYVEGAANFSRFGSSPGDLAEHVTRIWMGVRLGCANCHNHPLDSWTQDDYHGLSAIFSKVRRGRVVTISDRGEVTHPVTGEAAIARIPGQRFLAEDDDGREVFSQWLTSNKSSYLAKVTVNRIWQQLMGRGLVEPVDDIRPTNPATHPQLLDWLAKDFVSHDFSLKHSIALICNSAAYGRASETVAGNQSDETFYSHALSRPLEAEVIADAIADVTGIPLQIGSVQRAVALTDNRVDSPSLDILGRCDRSETCVSAGIAAASLTRSLHLINGPLINQRISNPAGRLAAILKENRNDQQVLDELYLLTLSRRPVKERAFWSSQLAAIDLRDPKHRNEFFEDVLWGLLTSDAFTTNH